MRLPSALAVVLAATVLATAAPAAAQVVAPGARVRVGAPGRAPVAGRLVAVRPAGRAPAGGAAGAVTLAAGDTLVVRPCRWCADTAVVLGPGARLERGRGRGGRPLAGMALGAAAGATVVSASVRRCTENAEGPPCAIGYVALPLVAVAGAVVGGAAGLFLPVGPERWQPVVVAPPRGP